jgi:hypothetical protein
MLMGSQATPPTHPARGTEQVTAHLPVEALQMANLLQKRFGPLHGCGEAPRRRQLLAALRVNVDNHYIAISSASIYSALPSRHLKAVQGLCRALSQVVQ